SEVPWPATRPSRLVDGDSAEPRRESLLPRRARVLTARVQWLAPHTPMPPWEESCELLRDMRRSIPALGRSGGEAQQRPTRCPDGRVAAGAQSDMPLALRRLPRLAKGKCPGTCKSRHDLA